MTVYDMNHDTIKFSSTNLKQVEFYEGVLRDVSLEDIKKNNIDGRHALLLNMSLAGDSDLFFELMGARELRNKYLDGITEKYKKRSDYRLIRDELTEQANEYIYRTIGWIL